MKNVIELHHGVNKANVVQEIKSKSSIGGANTWMLMCSIIIASIGLNTNSQAVIIGAMLISPLMSPILGIGLGVGINDKGTLKNSLFNFGIAVIIAILTSFIYFALTPLSDFTEQMDARTKPTILDVFIAIAGGVAGIISIVRKDISTTLPGVAIATALMPPLCVTGYGLWHGLTQGAWHIAFTSFYLFFLNSFFVALSTYIIIRFLKFPYTKYVNQQEKKRNLSFVFLFSLIMIIPSFYIFNKVFKDMRLEQSLNTFEKEYIGDELIYLDDRMLIGEDNKKLILKVYGDSINELDLPRYKEGLQKLNLTNTSIEIISTSEINLQDMAHLENKIDRIERLSEELEEEKDQRKKLEDYSDLQGSPFDYALQDSSQQARFYEELQSLYPGIKDIQIGYLDGIKNYRLASILLYINEKEDNLEVNKENLQRFLKVRLKLDTIQVVILEKE